MRDTIELVCGESQRKLLNFYRVKYTSSNYLNYYKVYSLLIKIAKGIKNFESGIPNYSK